VSEHRRKSETVVLLKTQQLRADVRERSRRRRRISYVHENARGEILRFAQNDSNEAFFRSLLKMES
jgi:hypothetical protein